MAIEERIKYLPKRDKANCPISILRQSNAQIMVVGDDGTGKTSLIWAATHKMFIPDFIRCLPPCFFNGVWGRYDVPLIIDNSSINCWGELVDGFNYCDAVVLTYACDRRSTFDRLTSFWLPLIRRLEVRVPVIVVGCKLDLKDGNYDLSALMWKFPEIETCIECSALQLFKTEEVFFSAVEAVRHPTTPLFDRESKTLRPRCMRALKRIFYLFDVDKDSALSDKELNEFQVRCFGTLLEHDEIVDIKGLIQDKLSKGVNEFGVTLEGFCFLHSFFLKERQNQRVWSVLRMFGYNNELKLRDDYLSTPTKKALDQSVELTNEAVQFLKGVFNKFDNDKDGVLCYDELEDLFSAAPESPWNGAPYDDVIERTTLHGLSLSGFLSVWALMTLLDPAESIANLIYIGYNCNAISPLHITRRRSEDRKNQQTKRNVFQCFVFGPKGAGKSALLTMLLERDFSETYIPAINEKNVVNVIHKHGGSKKTLILKEVPEDGVKSLLSNKESLGACDVAIFVFDRSSEASLNRAIELLSDVARQGEESGFAMPCLLIAAKSDLSSSKTTCNDSVSTKFCMDMGIDAPICISVKEGQIENVFSRIIRAAEHPHLSVPETYLGRIERQRRQLLNHGAIMCLIGGLFAALWAGASKRH